MAGWETTWEAFWNGTGGTSISLCLFFCKLQNIADLKVISDAAPLGCRWCALGILQWVCHRLLRAKLVLQCLLLDLKTARKWLVETPWYPRSMQIPRYPYQLYIVASRAITWIRALKFQNVALGLLSTTSVGTYKYDTTRQWVSGVEVQNQLRHYNTSYTKLRYYGRNSTSADSAGRHSCAARCEHEGGLE